MESHLPQKRNIYKIEKYMFIAAVLFLIAFNLYNASVFFKNLPHTIPLQDQFKYYDPGLIAVKSNEFAPRLSIYRMRDAQEERLEGTWNVNFINDSQLLIFGSFPPKNNETYSTSSFFLLQPRGTNVIDMSNSLYTIQQATVNRKGTYALVKGLDKARIPTSCLVELTFLPHEKCRYLINDIMGEMRATSTFDAFWNPQKDHELIIKESGGKNRWLTFDPWEKKPVLIKDTQRKEYETITELPPAHQKINKTMSFNGGFEVRQFPFLLVIKNVKLKTKKLFFTSFKPDFYWLADGEHLLLADEKESEILDAASGTRSIFVYLPPHEKREITVFSPLISTMETQ